MPVVLSLFTVKHVIPLLHGPFCMAVILELPLLVTVSQNVMRAAKYAANLFVAVSLQFCAFIVILYFVSSGTDHV
jgi:hypothetical protein